jgi:hypothetical protein
MQGERGAVPSINPSGNNVGRTRFEIQARLDALAATLRQMKIDGARGDVILEALELLADLPSDIDITEFDRIWWWDQLGVIAQRHGLKGRLRLRTPEARQAA